MKTLYKIIFFSIISLVIYSGYQYFSLFSSTNDNKEKVENTVSFDSYFEERTVVNNAGDYLVLDNGETIRLSGVGAINQDGNEFIVNSLTNRKVWIFDDGVDANDFRCVYLYLEKPVETFSVKNSFNRLLISKCYGKYEEISNGIYKDFLQNSDIYPTK